MKRLALMLTPLLIAGLMGCGGGSSVTAPPAVPAQWSQTSGLPGTTIVSSLTASGTTMVAGTAGGGVFRSTDGGLTWTAATTQPTNLNVYSLTSSGTTLVAGTYGGGVFRSTDGGLSWKALGSGQMTNEAVYSLTASGTTLLAGTGRAGIWRCPL